MRDQDIQLTLTHFEHICRTAGLKVTHQRMEIYRELLAATDHPCAEALHKRLEKRLPTLSLDTVYRTLSTFDRYNLVHRLETQQNQGRYEALTRQHHHFLCDQCGKVVDFEWQHFDAIPLPDSLEHIGAVKRKSVVIHGQCAQCKEAREALPPQQDASAPSS